MKFKLEKINTSDDLILNGMFFNSKKQSKKAVLFIHGFPGNFYLNSEIISNLAEEFDKSGFGLLSLNTRGHDIINVSFKKNGDILILGSAYEDFDDCLFDIETGIKFLNSHGFDEIILIGISGGADKTGFYLSKKPNKSVKGSIFLSLGSNISIIKKELKDKFDPLLKKAFGMAEKGRGNELILEPELGFPVSWKRFISLYSEESNENVFPIHNNKSGFKSLAKIKVPILTIVGEKDKFFDNFDLDKIAELLKQKAKNSPDFRFKTIKKTDHQFKRREKELSVFIKNWMKNIK
jgi:predicted alpha/beta-fold hydrolase